jgi:hypothetical protein
MSGGGGTTTVQNNSPPQQYLDAYSQVLGQATQDASVPYQQYPGQLQAGFSPLQQQGFNTTAAANGISAPYINTAATDFTNATNSLTPSFQPQSDQASQQYQQAAGANLQGALSPYQTQAAQGFAGGSQAIDPTQYSGAAIQGFQSPYTQQVVNATQAQFNQQNAQAATALSGNAASKGALGGDRLGVAQAQLAGQQQMAQAPVIAGLNNTGFQNAQQEFNTQQATNLSAQQNTAARQLQGASGIAGLGAQSMTAAQQQAAIEQQAGAGFAGLGQMGLSAAQSQGWLNSQAGSGMAGLGNQALSNTLAEGSADQSAGAQQQAQAQQALNIPYQQYQAQLAFPYQQTGWLSNIALGLGSGSGGTGSTTAPGPSAASQIAGLGTAGVGAYGLYNSLGSGGSAGATDAAAQAAAAAAAAGYGGASESAVMAGANSGLGAIYRRGGALHGFDGGGNVPDLTINGVPMSGNVPGATDVTAGGGGAPDPGASVIPSGGTPSNAAALIKKNYGTTTNSPGSGDSTIGSILKTAGTIAAGVWGGPGGAMAANALGSQVHFNRGGAAGGFDGGGAVGDVPASPDPTGFGTLNLNQTPIPSSPTTARHGNTIPKPPTPNKPEDPYAEGLGFAKAVKGAFGNSQGNDSQSSNRGGSVPVLPRGFAAGGSAPITVSMVPDAQGRGVPTMMVNPPSAGSGSSGSGSASDQLTAYLAQNAAGASHAAPQFTPPPPSATPPPPSVVNQGFFTGVPATPTSNDAGGGGKRGGMVNGFARGGFDDGGDVDPGDTDIGTWDNGSTDPDASPSSPRLGVHARHLLARGSPPGPVPTLQPDAFPSDTPPPGDGFLARNSDPIVTPDSLRSAGSTIAGLPSRLMQDWQDQNRAFNRQTAPKTDTDLSDPVPAGIPPKPDAPRGAPDNSDPWANRGSGATVADGAKPAGAGDFLDPSLSLLGGNTVQSPEQHGPPAPGGAAAQPPAGPGGFAKSTPPAQRGAPAGGGSASSGAPSGGFGAGTPPGGSAPGRKTMNDASDELLGTRALKEDKANPWLALMQAGFGMMAGTSPHAMVNIGTGAMSGLNQYVTADRAAKDLAAKVDENRVRLKETQAYRDVAASNYAHRTDATSDWHMAAIQNTAEWHARVDANVNRGMDIKEAQNEATNYYKDANLQLSAGNQVETNRHHVATEGQAAARATSIDQAHAQAEQFKKAHDVVNYSLTLQRIAALNGRQLDPKEADRQAQESIAGQGGALGDAHNMAPPAASAPVPPPKVGDVVDGFTYRGGDPSQPASWAK